MGDLVGNDGSPCEADSSRTAFQNASISRTPTKNRSLSDSAPLLFPSPIFKEPRRAGDDHVIIPTPRKSPSTASATCADALFQYMPRRHLGTGGRVDLDARDVFENPSTMLPRHSRGLDFSRACTNLHHSTLADQSSPDSSPTITQKGIMIPSRRSSMHLSMQELPRMSIGGTWPTSLVFERPFMPRSIASTNAFTSDASSNSSDDEDNLMRQDEPDDVRMSTPRSHRGDSNSGLTPYIGPRTSIPEAWMPSNSPINPFMLARNERFQSSSSDNGPFRLDEAIGRSGALRRESSGGFFGTDGTMTTAPSRRESLSQGTTGLHISTSNESGDENGVVRRPVTRRSNLLPKTKNFARIRAALFEESAPIDSEAKREAQVVRQVRVSDGGGAPDGMQTCGTAASSPDLLASSVPRLSTEGSDMSDVDVLGIRGDASAQQDGLRLAAAPDIRRGSTHREFFPKLYNSHGGSNGGGGRAHTTPPPPPLFHSVSARSSSGVSEDTGTGVDSPRMRTPPWSSCTAVAAAQAARPEDDAAPAPPPLLSSPSSSSSPAFQAPLPPPLLPSATDLSRRIQSKRRRDEDFDVASIKRRAVSPGMTVVAGSPVAGQSLLAGGGGGGVGGGGAGGGAAKRVGMQGMVDTHDGIMKMSID